MKKIVNFAKNNSTFLLVVFLFVVNIILYRFLWSGNVPLKVHFLDVGQGDAIYIRNSFNDMLIDTGPGKNILAELGKVMPFYDRKIDIVLITHPDKDHIGGLPDILESFDVGTLVLAKAFCGSAICEEIKKFNINKIEAREGLRFDLGLGALATVVYPNENSTSTDSNTLSTVVKLEFGESSFLFMGDSPKKVEDFLLNKFGDFLKSDVLKLGHHGSKTSSGEKFVDVVSPLYAVVSAGEGNNYGHPNKEVLDIINSIGSQILKTLGSGTVVCEAFLDRNPVCI